MKKFPYVLPFKPSEVSLFLKRDHLHCFVVVDEKGYIIAGEDLIWSCFDINEEIMHIDHIIQSDLTLTELIEASNQGFQSKSLPKIEVKLKNNVKAKTDCTVFELAPDPQWDGKTYLFILYDIPKDLQLNLLQQFSGSFMEDVNLGVLLIDQDFNLVNISDRACNILGIKRKNVINQPVEEVFSNVPKQHQLVQRSILDGQVIRNHAFSWANEDKRYELLMDSNMLKDELGNTVGAYVIFKDVSNLRSLEEQVQRSDRLAMIGQIAAGTAHEIRNPLTSIKGFLQVLKGRMKQNGMDKELEYTLIMLKEIDRINELVNEFLLLSKPKNVSYGKVNIRKVIKEIFPIINNEAILHNIKVEYNSLQNLPNVVADGELLKQVCLNISKNGIEAMGDEGCLTITERVDTEERKVIIEIHDTGPGIPLFHADKIFDPFFTTKDTGTGLGLSICQRIIHDIGGTIQVASKGFGTTFKISIPYANEMADALKSE